MLARYCSDADQGTHANQECSGIGITDPDIFQSHHHQPPPQAGRICRQKLKTSPPGYGQIAPPNGLLQQRSQESGIGTGKRRKIFRRKPMSGEFVTALLQTGQKKIVSLHQSQFLELPKNRRRRRRDCNENAHKTKKCSGSNSFRPMIRRLQYVESLATPFSSSPPTFLCRSGFAY